MHIAPTFASPITSWNMAFGLNQAVGLSTFLAKYFIGATRVSLDVYEYPINIKQRATIKAFTQFILDQRPYRFDKTTTGQWRGITRLRQNDNNLYSPRHDFRVLKFGPKFTSIFEGGLAVLDLGCRVYPGHKTLYSYYRQMGAEAIGIDVQPGKRSDEVMCLGDARMLPTGDGKFEFISLPMIFGFGNPSPTYLEIAAGMSEIYRTLGNGLVHIAELTIGPEVIYTAQLMGFRCFLNPADPKERFFIQWNGIPVGILMIKRAAPLDENPFRDVIRMIEDQEITLSDDGSSDRLPF